MTKLIYKPLGVLLGVLGGLLAGRIFKQVWQTVAKEDNSPNATDRDRGWHEVLFAAAVEGAIFGGVKAIVDRAGATAFRTCHGLLARGHRHEARSREVIQGSLKACVRVTTGGAGLSAATTLARI